MREKKKTCETHLQLRKLRTNELLQNWNRIYSNPEKIVEGVEETVSSSATLNKPETNWCHAKGLKYIKGENVNIVIKIFSDKFSPIK